MNLEDAKILVAARIASMTAALQIGHWNIRVVFERLPDGVMAQCNSDPRYQHSTITIDPAQNEPDEIIRNLRHELIHIVLAEFEVPFDSARDEFSTKEGKNLLFEMQRNAVERSVNHIERIMDGLGATADWLSSPKEEAA